MTAFRKTRTTSAVQSASRLSTSSPTTAMLPSAGGSSGRRRTPSSSGTPSMTLPREWLPCAAGALGPASTLHSLLPAPEPPAVAAPAVPPE
eukprot:7134517-Alexandrium_andersonii.AAC.1